MKTLSIMFTDLDVARPQEPVGDIKCDICELVVDELDKLIGTNSTDAKINATIYELCSRLPATVQSFVSCP